MERSTELKDLANKAVAKSDFAGAVQYLTEAIALTPKLKELWSNRAFAWSALGKHEQALADAQQCIATAPAFSKGYLRAGRALISLGRHAEAADLLDDACAKMPQDYALQEALADAASGASNGASQAASDRLTEPAVSSVQSSSGKNAGGLDSSYYYAAVPASQRKLPVTAPQKIEPSVNSANGAAVKAVANGAIREDIDRKGSDSYYYAHDRKTDFTVPTVPKKLNADGSLTPWDGK